MILKQFYLKRKDLLYLNKDGIVACKRKEEHKFLYKYNSIVLPQLYQTELLFHSHDQMGHQGVGKKYNRIQKRFEQPGLKKACEKWISVYLSCQQAVEPRKLRFPLQSIESSGFNEVVQIDHQKICMTATHYNQVLVIKCWYNEICRGSPLHDSISGRSVQSLDKCVDSETRLPHHIPIRQWQSIRE